MKVSMRPVSFAGYNKPVVNNNNSDKNIKTNSSDREMWGNGFMAGVIMALVIGSGSTYMYNDRQVKNMVNDMADEYKNIADSNALKIEDVTGDEFPEIILKSKDGSEAVYDMKNRDIYYRFGEGEELVKQIK